MSETLYVKRGRRYHKARETVALDSLPEGAHLVIVRPGGRTVIHRIEPDHAALLTAAHDAHEAMANAVMRASEWQRDERQPMTSRELKAWEAYRRSVGPDALVRLSGASAMDIAQAGLDALVQAAGEAKEERG